MPSLTEMIKKAAMDAVAASNPVTVLFGTVTSVDPIQINVEQRMTLGAEQLALSSLVSDFEADMTIDTQVGKQSVQVYLGLSAGESVVLLRTQGGQKYLVLDRVR